MGTKEKLGQANQNVSFRKGSWGMIGLVWAVRTWDWAGNGRDVGNHGGRDGQDKDSTDTNNRIGNKGQEWRGG